MPGTRELPERKPFKEFVGPSSVGALADALVAVDPAFPAEAFVAKAVSGLDALELKQRVAHVAAALAGALPASFPDAAAMLVAAIPPARLDMWAAWPAVDFVEVSGLDHPSVALDTLAALTPYASAEFAIRPYLAAHTSLAVARLREWAVSPDEHLRRLVSEGSRPRLPWARRFAVLDDPAFTLPLVEPLRDDPSEYVRRSVANHLNDVAKLVPDLAVSVARRWLAEGGSHTAAVVRHGLRGLVRAGHAEALALVGAGSGSVVAGDLAVATPVVRVGDSLEFSFTLASSAAAPVAALVQYAIHHLRADGSHGRRVYFVSQRSVAPGAAVTVRRRHPFRVVTTRRLHPGAHRVEIVVDGTSYGVADFTLVAAAG